MIKHSEAHKKKIAASVRKATLGIPKSAAHKEAISEAAKRRPKKTCESCGKLITSNGYKQHLTACKKGRMRYATENNLSSGNSGLHPREGSARKSKQS